MVLKCHSIYDLGMSTILLEVTDEYTKCILLDLLLHTALTVYIFPYT